MISQTSEQQAVKTNSKKTLIGFVVALPEELTTLTKKDLSQGQSVVIDDNSLVFFSGAGASNAEQAAKTLLANQVGLLISWGCAAALSPDLKPGDLVLPEQVLSADNISFYSDKTWLQALISVLDKNLSVSTGTLLDSREIVASSVEKKALFQQSAAVALDMETASVFKVAHQAGIPCLAIRSIADPVSMDLPEAIVKSFNAQGQVELIKLLRFIVYKPSQISALIKLGCHFHAAKKTLKKVCKQLNVMVDFHNTNF